LDTIIALTDCVFNQFEPVLSSLNLLKFLNQFILKIPLRYLIVLSFLFPILCKGQNTTARLDSAGQKVTDALSSYFKKYPQEKLYIHTNQNAYVAGETIWYKVYTMAYDRPSQVSKIVYLVLSGPGGKLVIQNKLPLENGTAFGNIALPDSFASGWYHLQSYTNWMLNFADDGVYDRLVYLQNPRDFHVALPLQAANHVYKIEFFPEGGDLVDGNICNVAFKAVDEHGDPVNVYGEVSDGKTAKAKIITLHDGMGSFELEANAAINYTAKVHFPDNSTQEVALPGIKKTGIGLRINAGSGELEAQITYTGEQAKKNIILAAMQSNGTHVTYPLELSRGINVIGVKKSDFSTGIVRFTVFDEQGLPGAERIVFVNNNDRLKLSLNKDSLSQSPKGKNVVFLNIKDNNNKPAFANISVAVTDALIDGGSADNIYSGLLVSSELRGAINNPAWYFKNDSDTLRKQLDLVMLTNGWRHFNWDTIFKKKPLPLKHAAERSLFIAGRIENYHDKDKLKLKLMVTYEDSSKVMDIIEPDTTGLFILKDFNHPGAANVYFEALNDKNRKQPVKIKILNIGVDSTRLPVSVLNSFSGMDSTVPKTLLDTMLKQGGAHFEGKELILKTVHIKAQKLSLVETVIRDHVVHLDADNAQSLDLVNQPSLPSGSVIDYMIGRIPGLQITKEGDSAEFIYHGQSEILPNARSEMPYFYIDEASVTIGEVLDLSINDVALIQFAPPPVWFAPLNGGNEGAILVYTKKNGEGINKSKSSQNSFDHYIVNGYSVTREFASFSGKPNKPADFGTTLYWNHDLATDSNGDVKIFFYNPDQLKQRRIVIQTITADGKIGFLDETF